MLTYEIKNLVINLLPFFRNVVGHSCTCRLLEYTFQHFSQYRKNGQMQRWITHSQVNGFNVD